MAEGARDILPARDGSAHHPALLQFWVPVFHSIMYGESYGEMLPPRFSLPDSDFSLVRASPRWKRCLLTAFGLYNCCRSQPVRTQLKARGNFGAEQENIRGCWEEQLGLCILLISTEFIFKKNWTSEPLLCLSPQWSLSPSCTFQSLCITFQTGRRAQLQRRNHYGKSWFSPYHVNGSPKGTTEGNERYFVEVLFSIKHF